MSEENCQYKNPLQLKGTAQENRFPKFLDPDLVQIDGKTTADYQRIVSELAELVQFYNADHLRDGDWGDFFKEGKFDEENPHIALFNAFVELISYAQEDINSISRKHLEFYYKEVLQLAAKQETPDEAHILFTLANNISSYLVPEGTYLKAGKDDNGKERYFKTEKEIVVNKIAVKELKSVYIESDSGSGTTKVFAAPIANSLDGIGGDLDEDNPKWPPFGEAQKDLSTPTMEYAEVGFAVASSFLLMKEGDRTLKIRINFAENHLIAAGEITSDALSVHFSGEEDWIIVQPEDIEYTEPDVLEITVLLSADEKSVVAYSEELYGDRLNTELPVMKMIIDQEANDQSYGRLISTSIESIDLSLEVSGLKDVILQNETGTLDASKPFEVFASRPAIGSQFYIGSQEIFSKPLTGIDLNFDWQDLPDFSSYYDAYVTGITEASFKVDIAALRKRNWDNLVADKRLFSGSSSIALTEANVGSVFSEMVNVEEADRFSHGLKNGFLRLELSGPTSGLFAFGHSQYQDLYVLKTLSLAHTWSSTAKLPNAPYTPKAKSLSIDYVASLSITLNVEKEEDDLSGHFFHIMPYGAKEIEPSAGLMTTIVPKWEDEGNFYIGLEQLDLPQTLNILFQIADGSANPDKNPSEVVWSYLSENEWIEFEDTEILGDSSDGLINSGIVTFDLPKGLSNTNTILTDELYWLKASVQGDSDSVSQLIDVHPQAVTAVFENNDNDLSHLENALPAKTITKLRASTASIRELDQPYASFNGKLPEEEENYYRRVAERLRHKNRAITIWDFERLVLEEFPSVYKLKCLNHTRVNTPYSEKVPGYVSLIVVSNLRNQNAVNPLQPTTSVSTLEAIKDFLAPIQNPFIELDVENPFFEEIMVEFNVKFYEGKDVGYYKGKLNEDIKKFLSPWAYEEGEDISFNGIIHKSVIIDFIEELEYVDFLTCFRMYHIIDGDVSDLKDVNEATPSKSAAILVSASDHTIDTDKLIAGDCTCDDENILASEITDGIGTMTVALDFIVNKP